MHSRTAAVLAVLQALSICLAGVLASACGVAPPPRSRRIDALVQLYTPLVRLGEDETSLHTRLPSLGNDADSLVPAIASLDGYALARAHFSSDLLEFLRRPLLNTKNGRGRVVEEIVLSSGDRGAPSRAIARINAVFEAPPEEGCITTPDQAEIRILAWRADNRGVAAVMIPVGHTSGQEWRSTLLFARRELDLGDFAPWYEPRFCPDRWLEEKLAVMPPVTP